MSFEAIVPIVLAGAVIFFIGCFFLQKRSILKNGQSTNAIIVKTIKRSLGKGHSFYPELKYTVDGCEHEVAYNVGNISPKYKDGEVIKTVYHKKKVEWVVIVNE